MSKYNDALNLVKGKTGNEIIAMFKLTKHEHEALNYVAKKGQCLKADAVEYLVYSGRVVPIITSKADASLVLGSLKRKGLIYSVIDLPGWIGTEIKIW